MNGKLAQVQKLLDSIDWGLLRQQKIWLLRQEETSPEAAGLLSFLDALQDLAVDVMGFSPAQVFDFPEEPTDAEPQA